MSTHASNSTVPNRHIPVDPAVHIAPLLDPGFVSTLVSQHTEGSGPRLRSVTIGHIRYAPGTSCTVSYRVECDGIAGLTTTRLYARSYDTRGFRKAERGLRQRNWIPGTLFAQPLAIPELRAVVYEFPNDARLPGLGLLSDPTRFNDSITRHVQSSVPDAWRPSQRPIDRQTLRYKPESRLVARCTSYWKGDANTDHEFPFILRIDRSADDGHAFGCMQRLARKFDGRNGIGTPRPLFAAADEGVTAIEHLSGKQLSELLRTDEPTAAIERTARALARLHEYTDPALPTRAMSFHIERAQKMAQTFEACGGAIPERANQVLELMLSLAERSALPQVGFVHGDFHQGQVLCSDETIHFLDFERCYIGDTTADIGNFLSQLELLRLRGRLPSAESLGGSFVDAYGKASGGVPTGNRLLFWVLIAMLELALKDFRRLKPEWPARVLATLERCLSLPEWLEHS